MNQYLDMRGVLTLEWYRLFPTVDKLVNAVILSVARDRRSSFVKARHRGEQPGFFAQEPGSD